MTETRKQSGTSRALIWWRDAELGALRARIGARLTQFGRDWGLNISLSAVENACDAVLRPTMRDASAWAHLDMAGPATPGAMWVAGAAEPSLLMQRALFGEVQGAMLPGTYGNDASMAGTVAAQAWNGFVAALAGIDAGNEQGNEQLNAMATHMPEASDMPDTARALPVRQQLPWSGAIRALITIEGEASVSLGWHLDPVAAQTLMGTRSSVAAANASRAPLTPVLNAMHRQSVGLTARLADIELDLGALLALEPGDVITIGHALDHPVPLYLQAAGESAPPIATGHLGELTAHKAIQLLPPAAAASR